MNDIPERSIPQEKLPRKNMGRKVSRWKVAYQQFQDLNSRQRKGLGLFIMTLVGAKLLYFGLREVGVFYNFQLDTTLILLIAAGFWIGAIVFSIAIVVALRWVLKKS